MATGSHMRKHIVIVGAGFGGLAAALELEAFRKSTGLQYNVTLIDKNCYHTYHALLYEVATATATLTDADLEAIEGGVCVRLKALGNIVLKKRINLVQASVTKIDLASRRIDFTDQPSMNYDFMVLALGSQTHDFGIPGLSQYSLGLKELPDALRIHQRLHRLLSQCERVTGPIRIVIGGAGISGVETAGELQHYILQRCRGHRHGADRIVVTVLEAGPAILPGFAAWAQTATLRRLQTIGVQVKTGQRITRVDAKQVHLQDGTTIPADVFIWAGGIKAHQLIGQLGIETSGKQQLPVNAGLQIPTHPEVYAVGDAAYIIDPSTQRPVPQIAPLAVAQGRVAAANIVRQLERRPLTNYRPQHLGYVFPVGGRWAVSSMWGLHLTGWLGWCVRKLEDLKYFMSILRFHDAWRVFWQGGRVYLKND